MRARDYGRSSSPGSRPGAALDSALCDTLTKLAAAITDATATPDEILALLGENDTAIAHGERP